MEAVASLIHGDLAAGNILIDKRELVAVIDFGGMAVGDPSCDLTIAWTFFDVDSRAIFKKAVDLDDGTWARARAWALWKATFHLCEVKEKPEVDKYIKVVQELIEEYKGL